MWSRVPGLVMRRAGHAIVVGAGIVGAASARALARRGWAVTVLERGAAAGATSSHCEGNLLVSDKPPGPELDLALAAGRQWPDLAAELADELGRSFPDLEFEPKGGLVVATTPAGARGLRDLAASQRAAGVVAEEVDPDAVRRLEPHLRPESSAAVFYPQDAQLQPTAAVEALLASARRAGASVRTGVAVEAGLVRDGRLVGVRTSAGEAYADLVVNCAGPWAGEVAARLGVWLPVQPRQGTVLVTTRMPHRIFHKVYDGDYVSATQSGDAGLQTSAVIESTVAGTVLIGSSRQRVGFEDRLQVRVLAELARKAIALFPFLAGMNLLRSYSGFRPYLPDHLPVIGPDHRLPGLYHVTGHEGAGIGLSAVSADLLAALVCDEGSILDPAPFSLRRPGLQPHLAGAGR